MSWQPLSPTWWPNHKMYVCHQVIIEHHRISFSDGGIKTLPVGGRDEVVVTEVVLVLLLDSGAAGVGWLLTGEYISSHLLLLFSLQGNYFITNWGQLAAPTANAAAAAAATAAVGFL